jgi:uncharacterized OB-fold protein
MADTAKTNEPTEPQARGKGDSSAKTDAATDVIVVDDFVALTYTELLPPETVRFADALIDGRIIGQKCPACGRVYVAGKGFCPIDVVVLGPEHEVTVADTGVVTGYTIVTPVRYYGQTKTEPFVYASVLLDGASSVLGGQEIVGISNDEVREGLRVRAVWKPPEERSYEGHGTRGWGSVSSAVDRFEWTGEPDVPREQYAEFVA